MWIKVFSLSNEEHYRLFGLPLSSVICGYCGYAQANDPSGAKHDLACRYLWNKRKLQHRGEGINTEVYLENGIMPASESFF